jgi:hypothetical protein
MSDHTLGYIDLGEEDVEAALDRAGGRRARSAPRETGRPPHEPLPHDRGAAEVVDEHVDSGTQASSRPDHGVVGRRAPVRILVLIPPRR